MLCSCFNSSSIVCGLCLPVGSFLDSVLLRLSLLLSFSFSLLCLILYLLFLAVLLQHFLLISMLLVENNREILKRGDFLKFFRILSCMFILLLGLCSFVYADDVTSSAIEEPEPEIFETQTDNTGITVVVNNPDNSSALSALTDYIASRDSENSVSALGNEPLQLRSVNVSNETITASDANGFKAVILGLLGDYTTIITDYTYQTQQGYTQHSIDVTPDWSWVCSAAIFVVVVYCSMKMIGGLLCSR